MEAVCGPHTTLNEVTDLTWPSCRCHIQRQGEKSETTAVKTTYLYMRDGMVNVTSMRENKVVVILEMQGKIHTCKFEWRGVNVSDFRMG